jgi:hypothetical protein
VQLPCFCLPPLLLRLSQYRGLGFGFLAYATSAWMMRSTSVPEPDCYNIQLGCVFCARSRSSDTAPIASLAATRAIGPMPEPLSRRRTEQFSTSQVISISIPDAWDDEKH